MNLILLANGSPPMYVDNTGLPTDNASNTEIGVSHTTARVDVTSFPIALTELALFLVSFPLMYKLGDLKTLLNPHVRNWALIIPLGALLGSLLALGRDTEVSIPTLLIIPSLIFIAIFIYSIVLMVKKFG